MCNTGHPFTSLSRLTLCRLLFLHLSQANTEALQLCFLNSSEQDLLTLMRSGSESADAESSTDAITDRAQSEPAALLDASDEVFKTQFAKQSNHEQPPTADDESEASSVSVDVNHTGLNESSQDLMKRFSEVGVMRLSSKRAILNLHAEIMSNYIVTSSKDSQFAVSNCSS